MAHIARKVTVAAPVREVYDTWTRYAELADALPSVKRIEQLDEDHLRWHVAVAGQDTSFDAEIVDEVPGARIAWRSTEGPAHAGAVSFRGLDEAVTEVEVTMDVPADELEVSDAVVEERLGGSIAKNLRHFKRRVEKGHDHAGRWSGGRPRGLERVAAAVAGAFAVGWGVRGAFARPRRRFWPGTSRPSWRRHLGHGAVALVGAFAAAGIVRDLLGRR